MARMSLAILTQRADDAKFMDGVRASATKNKLAILEVTGAYDEILGAVEEWVVLPEIILFDIPPGKDVMEALDELAERLPEGEASVILTGVANDIATYRKLKRMGIAEIYPDDPGDELDETLAYLATKELRETEIDPRRVVYVWAACGGAGGTSLAHAFAKFFARDGRRTLLIDLDLYSAPAAYMLAAKGGAQETYGLVEALASPDRIDAVFLERTIQKAGRNLYYLSSIKKPTDTDLEPAAVPRLIARAQQNFDMVVVDIPWRCMPAPEWGRVNGTSFVVASPTATSYLGFSSIVNELRAGMSKEPIIGVINKSGEFRSNDFTPKMFSELLDGEVMEIPYDPAATGRMFFAQKTLIDVGGKVEKAMGRILAMLPEKTAGQSRSAKSGPNGDGATKGILARLFGK